MSAYSFVHLKCHTEYSIKDSIIRVNDLVDRVKADGMFAVAVSDHSNLFALVKFYQKAIAVGIKPIIAADLWLYDHKERYRITCYCQNNIGYRHLTRLISRAYLEGQIDGVPTIRWSWLEEWNQGLLVLSGAREGDVGHALLSHNAVLAEQYLQRWLSVFPDRYYLELQRTHCENEEDYIHAAVALATAHQVPVVATNDVCFLSPEDFEAHEARVCIQSGYILADPKRPHHYRNTQYFRSQKEMEELFSDIPEALENTIEIAKRCTLELSLGQPFFPNFPTPKGMTLELFLEKQVQQGLEAFFNKTPTIAKTQQDHYRERLKLELHVIHSMGFSGYFLIVADFIGWAKSHHIPVGPGRGSGAGSLVAFCLGITGLDPIEHDLLFERFLNPERISMPDFDIDFCMERRDEVIDYVVQRYGRQSVSQIITYGTMAAKAVVRDVGRVLGMPYGYVDKIAKLIPFELGMTLRKALADNEQLADRYHEEEEVQTLIDLAMKLEGTVRNAGKHAGGVVIAPTRLTDFTPLFCEPDGSHLVTQFDKDDVEAVGLVKFDFLGLRTLTIIDWALKSINKRRSAQNESVLDIERIPLDDKKTYQLLCDCATTAVFQLESRGMKELVRRLQPDHFNDVMALVALFRPGPLQSGMVDDYINRKHGRTKIDSIHPDLEPILRNTNGVILYQEQVIQIARVLSGYSLGEADILRRAMGKKKPEEMAKQREVFIQGAQERGVLQQIAEPIFDLMEKFAGYGFNKSHSAAYALISYQTAWLKAHYPAEFMAAVLSSDMDNTDKVVLFLNECSHMGLIVNPPNIAVSLYTFTVNHQGQIEYGLGAIKGVGETAAINIVEEREHHGLYCDLFDFCQRIDSRKVNKRVIEPLIVSGAMDGFKQSRAVLMASLEKAMKSAEQHQRDQAMGQVDLFNIANSSSNSSILTYFTAKEWDEATQLRGEKETLGYYISGHPLRAYEQELGQLVTAPLNQLSRVLRKEVIVAGMIVGIRVINTKNGRRLAVIMIEDCTGKIELTLFHKLYESVVSEIKKEQIIVVRGKVEDDTYTGGLRVVAESIETLDKTRSRLAKQLVIQMQGHQEVEVLLNQLSELMQSYQGGSCPVTIDYRSECVGAQLQLGSSWHITPQDTLLLDLKRLYGDEAVMLEY